jgi:hypothetical protein
MLNNTSPTSRTSQNLDPFEAFSREAAAEFAKWERALAIAGYTGSGLHRSALQVGVISGSP